MGGHQGTLGHGHSGPRQGTVGKLEGVQPQEQKGWPSLLTSGGTTERDGQAL